MKISRTREIKDGSLGNEPDYYRSHGGNPYQSRLDSSVGDFNKQLYKVVKTERLSGKRDSNGLLTLSHSHKLGFRPIVRGTYVIKEASDWDWADQFPVGTRGLIPENKRVALWNVGITELTENDVTIQFTISSGVGNGEELIEAKVDFLTLENV